MSQAQAAAAANPNALGPVAQIFFYYEGEKRMPAADAELLRFAGRREAANAPWTPEELKILAALLLRAQDYDESARFSYLLTSSTLSSTSDKEVGLADLISLLLNVPEQPLSFANRDLSLYKNIASMDRHPGFLNGILTVALNTTDPEGRYASASQTANSYFHRAAASRLLDRLRSEFPASHRLPELEAELFSAYALYGQDDALLRDVPGWLTHNVNAKQYVATAMLLADADARTARVPAELSLYDGLLRTLADSSDHIPIGETARSSDPNRPLVARSPDYARVLDRYVSRLVALHRTTDALSLLRREIDRNPNDPGLYERLALFVEQNHLDNDLERTYAAALAHFKDTSWASKLARVYLRRRKTAEYQALARQIIDTFKGTGLASFLNEVNPNSPVLYRQVNLYAHSRFPHNMQFVTNLLQAYSAKATLDHDAYDKLLHGNWCNDASLKNLYFEYLTRDSKLKPLLAALPTVQQAVADKNTAALEFRAEAQSWLTEYESAAPVLVQLATLAPGERTSNDRAIAIERSLAPLVPGAFNTALQLAKKDINAAPADSEALVRTGEILADREQYTQARIWWTRAAAVRPGAADGYLTAATVFWDYFQFDDALRTIAEGRRRLRDPSLLAYEAGAINENQGNYKEAITSYTNACLRGSSGTAQERLLVLARRPATAPLVEQQTAVLVAGAFEQRSFELRVAILENQNRRNELQTLLTRLASSAGTTNETTQVQAVANRLGFVDASALALSRTVAITTDPIEKLTARLELARFYETHNSAAAAEREYRSLYADEANRLGIIRAMVDYQWRAKQSTLAVQTLVSAADRAQMPYSIQLRREAAEKAAASGQYAEARRLLDRLLTGDRYNGDYLAEKASTFAREGDTAGLTRFYASTLADMSQAALGNQEKTSRIAALRRGYILALTTAGQFAAALEQYQLVLNAFPEDTSLIEEVSRYAEAHQLAERLIGYYEKATHDAPRDYRWPLVLARIQTSLGDLAQAIATYEKAGYVRPDRSDIPLAKVDLQIRLLRFTDAIKTYQTLYELSYHDRQYLASEAEAYARLGNPTEAVRLLRAAYIEPQPQEPGGYINAMLHTNTWHLYDASQSLFREVRPLLSTRTEFRQQALAAEMEVLAATHRAEEAVDLVKATVTEVNERSTLLRNTAAAMARYATPEEQASLAAQAEKPGWLSGREAIQFTESAGLRDAQAALLLAQAKTQTNGAAAQNLNRLQTSRLLFALLGQELESISPLQRRTPATYQQLEREAYQAYAKAGDIAAQRRLLNYSGGDYATLFTDAPGDLNQRLYQLAGQNPTRANAVVQHLLATAPADVVRAAVASRGRRLSPLWTSSYTALSGFYLMSPASWTRQAFVDVLGPRTVGGELNGRVAKNSLRGPDWFYFAGRYSEYLDSERDVEADDYREQALELAPDAVNSYRGLGDALAEAKQWEKAMIEYQAALQLDPSRAGIYDRLGVVEARRSHREAAIEQWRHAIQLLTARIEEGPLPPEYWPDAQAVLTHINHYGAMASLRPDIDPWMRAYIKRNEMYELRPLLEGLLTDAQDRRAALNWIVEFAQLPGAEGVLRELLEAPSLLAAAEKDTVYQARIAAAAKSTAQVFSDAGQVTSERQQAELEYIRYLVAQQRWADAWTRLQKLQPASDRPSELVLTAGALTGKLGDLLAAYKQQPESSPSAEQVLSVAADMQRLGHPDLALQMEEFEYGRELQAGSPPATAYFGMACVRFAQQRNREGLTLIRRATWTVGVPFENLKTAVSELEAASLKAEAGRYAAEWRKAEPWNAEAQLTAARLAEDSKGVDAVRRSGLAEYGLRVKAARTLRDLDAGQTGTDELALLTHKLIKSAEAEQPYTVEARMDAASATAVASQKVKLYREVVAIGPGQQEARWLLANAALTDHQDAYGLAVFQSLMNEGALNNPSHRETEQLAAAAFARRENYAPALSLYERLIGGEKAGARSPELTKARDAVLAAQKLSQLNASRRPVVTKEVTQHQLVRPRLATLPSDEGTSR